MVNQISGSKSNPKFTGRNFSVNLKWVNVNEWGLHLWDTDILTHEGRWLKTMDPQPTLDKMVSKLKEWDDFLDKGVSRNEEIIMKAKAEYKARTTFL